MGLEIYVSKTSWKRNTIDYYNDVSLNTIISTTGFEPVDYGVSIGSKVRNVSTGAYTTVFNLLSGGKIELSGQGLLINSDTLYEIEVDSFFAESKDYEKIDLYDDEPIEITQNIKDFRDVSKVLSDFSQQFKVPSSKANNRIFKNYYNNDILNGFDARFRVDCVLKLNGVDFKNGQIRLTGVDMKNNAPESYSLTFFGDSSSLKAIIGDDELDDIEELNSFTHTYNFDNIKVYASYGADLSYAAVDGVSDGIVYGSGSQPDMIYPLISAKSRYYYDSARIPINIENTRNVISTSTFNQYEAVDYRDLKPAIKIAKILEMVERKYNIQFSSDFFDDNNGVMKELYMWFSRESGRVEDIAGVVVRDIPLSEFSLSSGTDARVTNETEISAALLEDGLAYSVVSLTISPSDNSKRYTVRIIDENNANEVVYEVLNKTGVLNIQESFAQRVGQRFFKLKVQIEKVDIVTFVVENINIHKKKFHFAGYTTTIVNGYYSDISIGTISDPTTFNQISTPKMKIMDLLRGLMSMFNLVMYKEDNTYVVKPFDDYMSEGVVYDITKYCDFSKSVINRGNIYSNIDFEYKKAKDLLSIRSNEATNDEYGNERFKSDKSTSFDGGTYKVSAKFGHMLFENMVNEADGLGSGVNWGYSVSESENPINIEALVFCAYRADVDFYFTDGSVNEKPTPSYRFLPSNEYYDNEKLSYASINFGSEIGAGLVNDIDNNVVSDGLFKRYYENYILNIYDSTSRVLRIDSILPLHLLNNIKLNDTLIVGFDKYNIDNMKYNTSTGKTSLTLILDNYTENLLDEI